MEDGTIGSVDLGVRICAFAARLLVVDGEVRGAWMTGLAMLVVLVTLDVGEDGVIIKHLVSVVQNDWYERRRTLLTHD